MRDIRKPYHNLGSNKREDIKLKEVEAFESDSYDDIEYDRKGSPVMRASSHFGIEGVGKRKAEKDDYDVLKRDDYFSLSKKRPNVVTGKKRVRRNFKFALSFFVIAALLTGFYLWTNVYNTATIVVSPKYKNIDINQTFSLNLSDLLIASSTEVSQKVIPKSAPKQMDSKASGEIVIYNNFGSAAQKLVKNTRFQTKDGKIFRITDSVTVPGKVGSIPGSVRAKVFADTYGADYNIPPSDFSIPGFKGSTKFTTFYAKSVASMTEGSSGTVTIVAPEDIAAAKTDLTNQNSQKLTTDIQNLKYEGYVGFKDTPIYNITDNANELLSPDNNSYTLTSKAQIVFIKNSQLANMLAQSVMGDQYNSSDLFRIDDFSQLKFTLANDTNLNNATATVLVSGKVKLIWDYNPESIKTALLGQKVSSFTDLMKGYVNIFSNEKFELNPKWSRSFPSNVNRIKVEEVLN